MKSTLGILALQLSIVILAIPAFADPVTISFSGTINILSDPNNHFNGLFSIGESFTGTATYDVTTSPVFGNPDTYAIYAGGPDQSLTLDVGGYIFQDSGPTIGVTVNQGSSIGLVDDSGPVPSFVNIPAVPGFDLYLFNIFGDYQDVTSDAIYDPSIFALTGQSGFVVEFENQAESDQAVLAGSIDSLTITGGENPAVPEPSTVLLTSMGIAALARWARRRHTTPR
jgi:hypothetical protein